MQYFLIAFFSLLCFVLLGCQSSSNETDEPSTDGIEISLDEEQDTLLATMEIVSNGNQNFCQDLLKISPPIEITSTVNANVPGGVHSLEVMRRTGESFQRWGEIIYPSSSNETEFNITCFNGEGIPGLANVVGRYYQYDFYVRVVGGDSSIWLSRVVSVWLNLEWEYEETFLYPPSLASASADVWNDQYYITIRACMPDYSLCHHLGSISLNYYLSNLDTNIVRTQEISCENWLIDPIQIFNLSGPDTYYVWAKMQFEENLSEPSDTLIVILPH